MSSSIILETRILQRLSDLKLTEREVSIKATGVPDTIRNIRRGTIPSADKLLRIAQTLETTVEWLFGATNAQPPSGSPPSLDDIAEEYGLAFVEEIDLALGMGATYLDGSQPEVLGLVPFRESWLNGLYDGPLDRLKVVRGRGDSMEPTIREGDTILIDTSRRRLDDQDRIWAVAYGDLGMIRRIKATPRGTWLLIPDNKVVSADEATDGEATLLGRVIWIGRRI